MMLLVPMFALAGTSVGTPSAPPATPKVEVAFVENKGQWSEDTLYRLSQPGLDYWVAKDGLVFDYFQSRNGVRDGHVVRMRFENATPYATGAGEKALPGVQNYYRDGNAALGARRYESVRVSDVAKGVSAKYYLDAGAPRYDVEVAPGTDPSTVAIRYEGVSRVGTDGETVRFGTKFGEVRIQNLFAYQMIDGKVKPVEAQFVQSGTNRIGFRVGNYDRTRKLIIDPQVVVRGTYLGGSNSDFITDTDVQPGAAFAVAGVTASEAAQGFPITTGAYSSAIQSTSDAFVSVFAINPGTGSTTYPTYRLRYSTYISAPGNQASNLGSNPASLLGKIQIRLRDGGSCVIGMTAGDANFPVNGSAGVIITDPPISNSRSGPSDAWISMIDGRGGSLYSATYFGGGSNETLWDVDSSGSGLILAGQTFSSPSGGSPFPVTGAKADGTYGGNGDGFVAIVNAKCTGTYMATYVGGNQADVVRTIRRTTNGNIWVGGSTASTAGINGITTSSFDNTLNGTFDGFISVMGLDGGVNYSTYVGSNATGTETINDILESNGDVYVVGDIRGNTYSSSSVTNQPLHTANALDNTFGGGRDGFIARFNGSLTRRVAFSYLGGAGDDSAQALASYGTGGRIAATGFTDSNDFVTTPDAIAAGANYDAFLVRANNGLSILIHGTKFGGNGDDFGFGLIESNDLNNMTLAGITTSSNLALSSGNVFDGTNTLGDQSGFVAEFAYYDDLQRIVISRNPVAFGQATFVAMFFNAPVFDAGGQLAHVSVSDPSVLLSSSGLNPDSILVPQGADKAAVKLIPQAGLVAPTNVTVSVTSGGATRTAVVTVNP